VAATLSRMPDSPATRLSVAGATLQVIVTRKHVKNVNARLRGDTLLVSAPLRLPQAELDRAVAELARRLVRRVRARAVNGEVDLVAAARRVAARFPTPPAIREIRFSTGQRARWGSCSARDGTILLNAALAHMPAWVLDAVLAHELAHLFHRDHGPQFKALLRHVCPDSERARAFLHGVSWVAGRWESLPAVERAQLAGAGGDEELP
jgi:predicted metal-dependent hydrolase